MARNPSCPKCGATMFWNDKKKIWYCIQKHLRNS